MKTKKQIAEAAQTFQDAIAVRFPKLTQEVFLEELDGYDAWIRILVPSQLAGNVQEILDASVSESEREADRSGINIAGIVVTEKEWAHG